MADFIWGGGSGGGGGSSADVHGPVFVVGNSVAGDVADDVNYLDTGDGAQLRAALVAAALTGGTVYARRGTYNVGNGNPAVVAGGVILQGEGELTVLSLPVAGEMLSLEIQGSGKVRDLKLQHPFAPFGPLTTTAASAFVTLAGDGVISDVSMDIRADAGSVGNYPGLWAGIRLSGGKNFAIRCKILAYSSVALGAGGESIGIQAISDSCFVLDCVVGESSANDKIDVGIETGEASDIVVRGCAVLRSRAVGIRFVSVFGMSGMVAHSNTLTPESGVAIGLLRVGNGDLTNSAVQSNIITAASGAGGVDFESTSALRQIDSLSIQTNIMQGAGVSNGIRIAESGGGVNSNVTESLNIALGFGTPRAVTVTGGGLSQVGNI